MATVIRFARHGTKKRPYFRMVVQDSRSSRDGKFIEHIGAYDPIKGDASLVVERDRYEYWLSTGAQPSLSVLNRLRVAKKQWAAQGAPAEQAAAPKAPTKTDKPKTKAKSKEKEA